MKDLRDFVLRIKELTTNQDYHMTNSNWGSIQDIMIGTGEWNDAKKIDNQLQYFEDLMSIFFLREELSQETTLNLLAIFINIFQMAYIDNDGYIPDIFTDKSIDKE